MTADRKLVASALTYARHAGWIRSRCRMQGGWISHLWVRRCSGVFVEITEQSQGMVRLHIGVTAAASPTEASGGFTGTLRQTMDVLVALGHLPAGLWSEQAKVAELMAQLEEFLPRKVAA